VLQVTQTAAFITESYDELGKCFENQLWT